MSWLDSSSMGSKLNKLKISPVQAILIVIIGLVAVIAVSNGDINRGHLIYMLVLVPSIVLHEVSHGGLAFLFGDRTAKDAGRLTLNPIKHIDPIGTIILPVILVISFGTAFGYAKPVPVNVARMSRNQAMFTGLVGPATNIVLALLVSLVFALSGSEMPVLLFEVLVYMGVANVVLATFNLIPIPPLDGASVIERFLPSRYMEGYLKFRMYSMLILVALVLLVPGVLAGLFDPALDLWGMTLPEWLEQTLNVLGIL